MIEFIVPSIVCDANMEPTPKAELALMAKNPRGMVPVSVSTSTGAPLNARNASPGSGLVANWSPNSSYVIHTPARTCSSVTVVGVTVT